MSEMGCLVWNFLSFPCISSSHILYWMGYHQATYNCQQASAQACAYLYVTDHVHCMELRTAWLVAEHLHLIHKLADSHVHVRAMLRKVGSVQANGEWVPSQANFTSLATPNAIGSGKTALNTLLHEGKPCLVLWLNSNHKSCRFSTSSVCLCVDAAEIFKSAALL